MNYDGCLVNVSLFKQLNSKFIEATLQNFQILLNGINQMLNKYVLFFFTCFICSLVVGAEDRPFETVPFESKIMQETLDIHIQLPLFYKENDDYRYPVIYVLDAPVGLTLTSGVLDPLVGYGNAPQMIIVGLTTANRDRDLTPSYDEGYGEDTGGADKYLNFISQEVIPYIDKNYRSENFRILSGHSFGGLFVMHAFHKQPEIFQAHFAFSPSLFWGDKQTVKSVISFLENHKQHRNFLYMNIGDEGNPEQESEEGMAMLEGVVSIEKELQKNNQPNLDYKVEKFFDEPHQTTQIYGTVSSFRSLYPMWDVPYKCYLDGFVCVLNHFKWLTRKYGYQVDPKDWQINDEGEYQLNEKNNPTEAIKYFNYNLQRNPESISTLANLVDAHIKNGEQKIAMSFIDRLLKLTTLTQEEKDQYLIQKSNLLK